MKFSISENNLQSAFSIRIYVRSNTGSKLQLSIFNSNTSRFLLDAFRKNCVCSDLESYLKSVNEDRSMLRNFSLQNCNL